MNRQQLEAANTPTIRLLWSLITAPVDFVRDLFGVEDLGGRMIDASIDSEPCEICSDPASGILEGHPPGVQCGRRMVADCDVCLSVVDLTRYGWCVIQAADRVQHGITNRRPKPFPKLSLVRSK